MNLYVIILLIICGHSIVASCAATHEARRKFNYKLSALNISIQILTALVGWVSMATGLLFLVYHITA